MPERPTTSAYPRGPTTPHLSRPTRTLSCYQHWHCSSWEWCRHPSDCSTSTPPGPTSQPAHPHPAHPPHDGDQTNRTRKEPSGSTSTITPSTTTRHTRNPSDSTDRVTTKSRPQRKPHHHSAGARIAENEAPQLVQAGCLHQLEESGHGRLRCCVGSYRWWSGSGPRRLAGQRCWWW